MALVDKYIEYKDIKLSQIPSEIREKIIKCHKIVCDVVEGQFSDQKDLTNDSEISSFKQNFCKNISNNERSVRVYKVKENKFDCMIQLMNHVEVKSDKIHSFVKKVFAEAKKIIEKKFSMRLDNENDGNKEKFEGFDVYPTAEDSKEIWENAKSIKNVESSKDNSKDNNNSLLKESVAKDIYEEAEEFINFLDEYIVEETKEPKLVEAGENTKSFLTKIGQNIIDKGKVSESQLKMITNKVKEDVLEKNKDIFKFNIGKFEFKLDNSKENSRFELICDPPSSSFIKAFLKGTANLRDWFNKSFVGVALNKLLVTTMKGAADFFHFQQNLFNKYIKDTLIQIFEIIQKKFMGLPEKTKTLLSETEMKSVLSLVLHHALCFTKVNFSDYKMFENAKKEAIATVDNVFSLLEGMDKDNKNEVMKKIKEMTKVYKESVSYSPMYADVIKLESAFSNYFEGKYDDLLAKREREFQYKQFDFSKSNDFETNWQLESNQIRKLKAFSPQVIELIKQQYRKIQNFDDKMRLSGYIRHKIKIINWYLDIQKKGNGAYLVPHSISELESFLKELNNWNDRILRSLE